MEEIENHENSIKSTFSAKKSLGQNFLHAPNVISAMIKHANIKKDDIVLEIGPGKGSLTSKILESGAKVIAIEKDDRAIEFLKEKYFENIENGQLELIHEDILNFNENDHEKLKNSYILIANIPYYITGEFLRKFLESSNPPQKMIVMVQKEVAKRIVDKKESILSISIKAYGNPKYLFPVSRKFFRPIPNVDSAVILIDNISKKFFNESKIDEKYFFKVIKSGFAHKRKVVIRNLEENISKEKLNSIWEKQGWQKNIRAEDLTLEMWKKIVGDTRLS